jgi:Tautomerase enzyme
MPRVRVTMIKGKSPDYIKKMSDSIYEALVEAYQMTENDLFQIIEQLEPGDLIYDRHYGIKGSSENDLRPPALEHQLHLIRGFIDMTNGKSGVHCAFRRDGDEPPQKRQARRGVSFGLLKNPRRQPVRMRAIERR